MENKTKEVFKSMRKLMFELEPAEQLQVLAILKQQVTMNAVETFVKHLKNLD